MLAKIDELSNLPPAMTCYASERAIRQSLGRTGRLPGERSVSRAARRLAAQNKVRRRRILPGGRLPNGQISWYGTTVQTLVSRQEQRATARRKKKEAAAARRAAARPPRPPPPAPPPGETPMTLQAWAALRAGEGSELAPDVLDALTGALSPLGQRPKRPGRD